MKVIRIALMASVLGLLTMACDREDDSSQVYTTDHFKLEMAPFTDGNGSKIYLQFDEDHSHLIYEEGDQVQINGNGFTIRKVGGNWFAYNNGDTAVTANKFYAAYVDGTLDWKESSKTYGFNINSTMENKSHNKVILAGTSDDGKVLTMKPACAIIRINTGTSGRNWTDVSVGFGNGKVLKKGTLNPSSQVLSPGSYMDACSQGIEGDMLAMRWSKQGTSDYVGDEDAYWYVAVPIAGASVTTKLYFKWYNGSNTVHFQTNGEVTLNKGYVYTVGTERQSPFTDKGVGKYFFNVSGSSQVAFTAGNLQCQRYYDLDSYSYKYKWQFASSQLDVAGQSANNSIGSTGVYFDLFGYGTSNWNSGATAYLPSSTSETNSDYYSSNLSSSNADWGVYNGSTPGIYYGTALSQLPIFRTLTSAEWSYLINRSGKAGLVRIDGAYFGLLLLPNTGESGVGSWTNTTDVSLSGLSISSVKALTMAEWNKLEAIGAIFLPAAGSRTGTSTTQVNNVGYYWSATQHNANNGKVLYFDASDGGFVSANESDDISEKKVGCSVRLVISIG